VLPGHLPRPVIRAVLWHTGSDRRGKTPSFKASSTVFYAPLLRVRERVDRIVVAPHEWAFLEALRGRRALILPNHPSETEPSLLVGLARRLGEPFCYVATHEIFHGFNGWLLPRMGAFSIRRGWPDRPALRTATHLLAEQDRKLVLFPEGETHMCNDLILPLHKGAIQIGFWTLERLEALGEPATLPLCPW
jgi:1-acyl-sn-glycerol-3-phosphate acyltransferase